MEHVRTKRKKQHKKKWQLEQINQKELAKDGRLKDIEIKVKQYRKNRTFQNNEKKFYLQIGGDDKKKYQQPDAREAKQFWRKKWQPREYTKKAEWASNMGKELERLEEGPKAKMQIDSPRTTIKKIPNWKTSVHDGIHGFWFKKVTSINDKLAIEMNRCLQKVDVPEWMTKRKITLIQKTPSEEPP